MTDLQWVDEPVPCRDPECAEQGGTGEPDGDSEVRFYACGRCGYEFNHVKQVSSSSGTCQIGVSEDVRREFAAIQRRPDEPVLLQIGKRPE